MSQKLRCEDVGAAGLAKRVPQTMAGHMDGHMPGGGSPLSLQAFSRGLVPTPPDWSENNWACGYWLTEPDPKYVPPEDLALFLESGPEPIYLGFGSMPSRNPAKLTETVLAALEQTGQRAILATRCSSPHRTTFHTSRRCSCWT